MRKSKGSNTEPCELPAFTNFQLEDCPFKTTLWRLLRKNDQLDQEDYSSIL